MVEVVAVNNFGYKKLKETHLKSCVLGIGLLKKLRNNSYNEVEVCVMKLNRIWVSEGELFPK